MAVVLFDVDGTLIRSGNTLHHDAFTVALQEVYGVRYDLRSVGPGGRTDRWLAREALRRTWVDDDLAEERLEEAFRCMIDFYLEHVQDLSPYVLPGVEKLLEELKASGFRLGLITGNLEPIAKSKMERAGLGSFFGFGGYGGNSEVRSDVVEAAFRAAEERCGMLNDHEVVVVGDTPFDVEAAHIHNFRCMGVLTGPYTEEELREAGADLIVPDLADVDRVFRWIELVTSELSAVRRQ
jgi:phosphoglycolate phosphatase-like HAD superfamily hydrolase